MVEIQEVRRYLRFLSKATIYAKVGYVLELFANKWGLATSDIEPLRAHVPKGPVYMDRRSKRGSYVARWNPPHPRKS